MLSKPLTALKGVGERKAKEFSLLGVNTVYDLLTYLPRDYEDRRTVRKIIETEEGETVCVIATVFSPVTETRGYSGILKTVAELVDQTGKIMAVWFNAKWVKFNLRPGKWYMFYGKIKRYGSIKQIDNPLIEEFGKLKSLSMIVPIYPLKPNFSQNKVRSMMIKAMEYIDQMPETLPEAVRRRFEVCDKNFAYHNIHFPQSFHDYEIARKRLVFEELFLLQMSLYGIKKQARKETAFVFDGRKAATEFIGNLPFTLTGAQQRTVDELLADFRSGAPANRLVQGDVGSGKTVVAAAAMAAAAANGYCSAMMAPTEILASQHYETLTKFFGDKLHICLLVGSLTPAAKQKLQTQIAAGAYDIVVGTHALIQNKVEIPKLALVITDEQHRFGVMQRDAIEAKGNRPHTVVMSATPIPRTLALILYGDLDISVIDELPPGRKKIETYCIEEDKRARMYGFVRKQVDAGHQVYIVCPLVEESDSTAMDMSALQNVTAYADNLQTKVFPEYTVAFLHGRMKAAQKDEIMARFKAGEVQVLISTTVIEVGVDVPNANLMIVENAERFGLSQLHQLRGRVGRGAAQSYCVLMNQGTGEIAKKRMQVMCASNDGFFISQEDLKLRGPGDFFGVRQHGLPSMKIANLFTDAQILKLAQAAAQAVIDTDPDLKLAENAVLKTQIRRLSERIFL